MVVSKNEIWMANFSPSKGTEINKIRPCLVISPDLANQALPNIIVAPLTSTIKNYPSRVNCDFKKKSGQIMIDQIRTIDKRRLIKVLGTIDDATSKKVYEMIKIYFK
jgi:mRNA interferase MazF